MSQLEDYFNRQFAKANEETNEINEITENNDQQSSQIEDLSFKINKQQDEWTKKVIEISKMLKTAESISENMTILYSERQRIVEQYHFTISLLIKLNKTYRPIYAQKYKQYTFISQERYTNDNARNMRILSEMKDLTFKKESLENHIKFLYNTISSFDNIIYGLKHKIELIQMNRGK